MNLKVIAAVLLALILGACTTTAPNAPWVSVTGYVDEEGDEDVSEP